MPPHVYHVLCTGILGIRRVQNPRKRACLCLCISGCLIPICLGICEVYKLLITTLIPLVCSHTDRCRSDIQISCPNYRLLLVEVPNVFLKVRIPHLLLIKCLCDTIISMSAKFIAWVRTNLETRPCVDNISANNVCMLEFKGDDAPLHDLRIWMTGQRIIYAQRLDF